MPEVEDVAPAGPDGTIVQEPHDLAVELPGLLPGTDPVAHEQEILFVVGTALDKGGVLTHEDFVRWLERQQINLQRSGDAPRPGGKFPDPEPLIVKLARHLRYQNSIFRR